jgi:hypothetical protein
MLYKFQNTEKCAMCSAPFTEFKTLGKRLNKSQGKIHLKKLVSRLQFNNASPAI